MGFGALTCYRKFDRSDAPARPRIEGFFGLVCLITNSGNPMDFWFANSLIQGLRCVDLHGLADLVIFTKLHLVSFHDFLPEDFN